MQQRGERYGLKSGIAVLLKYSHAGVSIELCTGSVTCNRTKHINLQRHERSSDTFETT